MSSTLVLAPFAEPLAGHEATAAQVLTRSVPWESYSTAGVLTERDVQMIRRFDKRDKFTQAALWEKEGAAYAAVFMSVLRNVSKDETTAYTLALVDEALVVDKERIRFFHGPHMGTPGPFVVMLRLLERTDGFVQETAARLLSKLLSSRPDRGKGLGLGKAGEAAPPPPAPGSAAATCLSFLDWAVRTLRSPSHDRATAAAVGALAGLMAERELRAPAYRAGALALLAPAMRAAAAPPQAVQLLYEASLCVWLLTFLPAAAEATLSTGALAGLIETARAATKEKVVRVALAALRNLLESDGSAPGARAAAVAASGRLAATLRLKAFHDEEVLASIAALEAAAAAGAKAAGGFERYRQEVLSGALDWGGGRSSDSFWREHALGLEEHGFAVVKALCAILSSPSAPPRALAVACFDVGCIAAALPHGRVVISEAGGKAACMRLMAHEDEEVRKQALIATQKLLVVGWAFLEK